MFSKIIDNRNHLNRKKGSNKIISNQKYIEISKFEFIFNLFKLYLGMETLNI